MDKKIEEDWKERRGRKSIDQNGRGRIGEEGIDQKIR
jgi:hypothetical protein